jgi:hypothetical protein
MFTTISVYLYAYLYLFIYIIYFLLILFSDRIRVTRTAAVDSQLDDTTSATDRYLGYEGEPFEFKHLPQSVDQVACSSRQDVADDDNKGLMSVREWMASIIVQ